MLLFLSLCMITTAAPINLVFVNDTYNVTTDDDVIACNANGFNPDNLMVNLFPASSGHYIICVTDNSGESARNNIQINAAGSDLFVPVPTNQYVLALPYQTSCFYSDGNSTWHERVYQIITNE